MSSWRSGGTVRRSILNGVPQIWQSSLPFSALPDGGERARLPVAPRRRKRVFGSTRRVTASISGSHQLRPYDSGMPAQPALPSLSILLEQVASERATMDSHAESLDTKAGVVLGFTGVLVGLGATAQAMISENGVFQAGLGVAVAAALLATWAFVPRRYPVLEVQVLRGNLTATEAETQLELLDTQIEMVREAAVLVRRKGLRVGLSIACLAAAAALVVIGTLVAGGQVHA